MARIPLTQVFVRMPIMAAGAIAVTLAWPGLAAGADASVSANGAKNLARLNCGARITWISSRGTQLFDSSHQTGSASNLLLDDNTLSCELAKGDNTFLISLADISDLDRFTFIN